MSDFGNENVGEWGESRADKEAKQRGANFSLKAGETAQVRFVTKKIEIKAHWEAHNDHKLLVCPKTEKETNECPACDYVNNSTDETFRGKARARWRNFIYLIDREDGTIKKWGFSLETKGVIASIIQNTRVNILDYDLRITRVGSGMDTKYNIIKSENPIPLTDSEKEEISKLKPLSEEFAIKSLEELAKIFVSDLAAQSLEAKAEPLSDLSKDEEIPF
jgi:hypothetical protein